MGLSGLLICCRGYTARNAKKSVIGARLLCSLFTRHLLSADFAELFAADNCLDGRAYAEFVGFQSVAHLGNERAVGEKHTTAQRVAKQLSAELVEEGIAPFREQIRAQAVQAFELRAVHGLRASFERPSAKIAIAEASDSVEGFERIA